MKKIVIATHNQDKLAEVKSVLTGLPIKLLDLEQFPEIGEIEENGKTLLENSLIKARTVHKIIGLPTIADDTGLEVDYLNGAPGILSARYSGENATYQSNLNKLLNALRNVPEKKRRAQFRTVISYVSDSQEQWTEGIVKGIIIEKPRGEGGFGYDPVFLIPELNRTFSELSVVEKNKISHRGLALQKFRILIDNENLL